MRFVLLLLLPFLLALAPTQAEVDAADRRVAGIGYRLQTAGVGLCADRAWLTGLTLHGRAQYAPADRGRMGFPEGAAFAVLAVAPGSGAEAAGLKAGDAVRTVDGVALPADAPREASFAPVAAAEAALAASAADGAVTVDGREVRATEGCASRFQVRIGDGLDGGADGRMVSVSTGLVAFAGDDDELALILAHELAHNILRHRVRLDEQGVSRGLLSALGRNPGRIRATEDEADRLALHLMARAGYDIRVAPGFWDRYGRRTGMGVLSDRTHSGRRDRIAAAEREIASIEAQRAAGREPTPDPPIPSHPQQDASQQGNRR